MRLPFSTNIDELDEERIHFMGMHRKKSAEDPRHAKHIRLPIAKYNQVQIDWNEKEDTKAGAL